MNTKIKLLSLVLAVTVSLPFSVLHAQSPMPEPGFRQSAEKFTALLYHLEQNYVDSVNTDELVEKAIMNMLSELDPHSVYIPAEEVEKANESLEGNFEGIGIQFNILKDTITVVSPISGGPSEKLGIMAGDKIVSIEGENVAGVGINNNDVAKRLRGAKDTKVTVAILRKGTASPLDFDIVRDKIPIYSLDAAYMVNDKVGYIKLNRFSKTTIEEFHEAIAKLKKKGMEDLILDLQGNGGGLLETSIQLSDQFLNKNALIVYTEGKSYPRREANATSSGDFLEGRLVVLIDDGSASASEIVAGAMQDHDRGLVIGRRSFGKGLVQRPIPLPDGSIVRLTTQKYFTPSGRCIQKPYDEGVQAYYREKFERYEKGELWSLDSLYMPDSLKYFTDNNRIVYGGGGILPDIFVPIDTTYNAKLNSDLIRKGVMNNFAIGYTNNNRKKMLKAYPTVESFIEGFDMAPVVEALKSYAGEEEMEWVDEDYSKARVMIDGRLKALIARNLWDYSAYYQVFNPHWNSYKTAVEVLERNTYGSYNLAKSEF
jgi:carboxyl-terminal processing protease